MDPLAYPIRLGLMCLSCVAGCERGSAPEIVDPGAQSATVGQKLTINLFATDADGDKLGFAFRAGSVERVEEHARITRAPDGHGVFTFSPIAGHEGEHIVDFLVNDGTYETSLSVTLEVRAASGSDSTPRFLEPTAGVILDLEKKDCVEFDVVVEDLDTPQLDLALGEPLLDGASLTPEPDGIRGTVTWCPEGEQRQRRDATVVLTADDNDNPPAMHSVPIAVRPATGAGCPGEPPVIVHAPKNWQSEGDVALLAEISDDQGLAGQPYVFYAYQDPTVDGEIDFDALAVATMGMHADGRWSAMIPNPLEEDDSSAETADLYYLIEAADDDDADGNCDHRSDSPAQGTHHVVISRPDARPTECVDDEIDTGPGDDTRRQAMALSPIEASEAYTANLCALDDDWYWVSLQTPHTLTLTLEGGEQTDPDLELHSSDALLAASASNLSDEQIVSDCLDAGDYFARAFLFSRSDPGGGYRLEFSLEPCGQASCCSASATPGCGDAAIEACVCELNTGCCTNEWDDQCVDEVNGLGCGVC